MKSLQKYFYLVALVLFTAGTTAQTAVKTNPVITKNYQGITFSSEKSLVENLAQADRFSYTEAILTNPSLQELTAEGSYTIFVAPDAFFSAMDEEERDAFLASSNTNVQKQVFDTFIVPGRVDSNTLAHELKKRNGTPLYLKTVSGNNLGVKMVGNDIVLFDTDHQVKIVQPDFYHSKGFFHITEGYFMPVLEE